MRARRHPPEFCERCLRETTSKTTGNLSSVNGIGYTLLRVRGRKPCRECGSEVARVWFTFGFPIIPLSHYRVLWIDEPWYFGAEGSWLAQAAVAAPAEARSRSLNAVRLGVMKRTRTESSPLARLVLRAHPGRERGRRNWVVAV